MPEQTMKDTGLDIGLLGEGEETAVEIARAYVDGALELPKYEVLHMSPHPGEVVQNERRPRAGAG